MMQVKLYDKGSQEVTSTICNVESVSEYGDMFVITHDSCVTKVYKQKYMIAVENIITEATIKSNTSTQEVYEQAWIIVNNAFKAPNMDKDVLDIIDSIKDTKLALAVIKILINKLMNVRSKAIWMKDYLS